MVRSTMVGRIRNIGFTALALALLCVASHACAPSTPAPVVAASPSPSAPHEKGVLAVVAHQDDDLLLMNPALLRKIRAGAAVRTIYLTAGDAGLMRWDDGYLSLSPHGVLRYHWQLREEGIRAAYAAMARVANAFQKSTLILGGQPTVLFTLRDAPQVSLVFLRLPDGNMDGAGFEGTCHASLARLWSGELHEIRRIDSDDNCSAKEPDATRPPYDRGALIQLLGGAMKDAAVDEVWTLDALGQSGRDHSDHLTAARFAVEARKAFAPQRALHMFRGYNIEREPANLTPEEHREKQEIFMTYTPYDMCKYPRPTDPSGRADAESCDRAMGEGYASWEWRQFEVTTQGTAP